MGNFTTDYTEKEFFKRENDTNCTKGNLANLTEKRSFLRQDDKIGKCFSENVEVFN